MAATYTAQKLHPVVGSPVVASNGKQLGHVKEVVDNYLKVDARWARDYWLSFEDVLSADEVKTLLIVPSDEINLYKRSTPHAISNEGSAPQPDWVDREILRR